MAEKTILNPDSAPKPVSTYSNGVAVRGGKFVFVAGQVALDRNGNLVGAGDFKAQARQVFENIKAILTEAGAAMDDIVEIMVFLTDLSHYRDFVEVRSAYLKGNYPASTLVEVSGLVKPEWLVEVKAIAVVD